MEKIAEFAKVSYGQFRGDFLKSRTWYDLTFTEKDIQSMYDAIKLPERSSVGSAGYDFCSPVEFILSPGSFTTIPTGIRCMIKPGWFLMVVPRSGLGFKYRLQLDNSVGIIDSDYYHAKNEGHIMAKVTNDSKEPDRILAVRRGSRFMQGIFVPYGITNYDACTDIRTGGIGSTGN